MRWLIAFGVVVLLVVVRLVTLTRKAGPLEVSETALDTAHTIMRVTADDPGQGWSDLGSETTADGLNLRFDAEDDPAAEARFLAPTHERAARSNFGHSRVITLTSAFATEHIHTAGYVFRMRLRGTGAVVGKQVEIKMMVGTKGDPYAGFVQNEDDYDPAIGDWIEFEFVEILKLRPNAR